MIDLNKIGVNEILLALIPGAAYITALVMEIKYASIIGIITLTACLAVYLIIKTEKYSMKSRILEGVRLRIRGPRKISDLLSRRTRK